MESRAIFGYKHPTSARNRQVDAELDIIPCSPSERFRAGAHAAFPIAVAAAVFGASFGVVALGAGMGRLAPVAMSATTFAGSAQFAVATLIGDGGLGAAVVAAILLNARYAPLGIAAAPAFRGSPFRRLAEAQLIVDESWALANRGGGRFDYYALVGAGSLLWLGWVGGTLIGVAVGDALGRVFFQRWYHEAAAEHLVASVPASEVGDSSVVRLQPNLQTAYVRTFPLLVPLGPAYGVLARERPGPGRTLELGRDRRESETGHMRFAVRPVDVASRKADLRVAFQIVQQQLDRIRGRKGV